MWYKLALTEIDPTGQINFPDMGGHKFDLDELKFNVDIKEFPTYKKVNISAFIPGMKDAVGRLLFFYYKQDNYIEIGETIVYQAGRQRLQSLEKLLKDKVSFKTTGIGIGNKLYEKFLQVIHEDPDMSDAEYVEGLVHSLQAYKAKNNAFGEPYYTTTDSIHREEVDNLKLQRYELEKQYSNTPKENQQERARLVWDMDDLDYKIRKLSEYLPISHEKSIEILEPATWSSEGGIDQKIYSKPNVETRHKIPSPHSIKKENITENPEQLKLFSKKKNYKIAITQVDPSGQINMDFPGIKPKPFDIDKDVDFKIKYDEYWQNYTITAYLKNGRDLGHITIEAPEGVSTAKIEFITLNEYPNSYGTEDWEKPKNPEDRLRPDMMNELKQAGYDVDEYSLTRLKWGLGRRLYEEAKKFLQNNRPDVQYVEGTVHSRDAYNSRNSVFGLPHTAYDPDRSIEHKITDKDSPKQREEISRKISYELFPARFQNSGESEIPPSMYKVKHKLDRLPNKKSPNQQSNSLFDLEETEE